MTPHEINVITRFTLRYLKENKILTRYRKDFINHPLKERRIKSVFEPQLINNYKDWVSMYLTRKYQVSFAFIFIHSMDLNEIENHKIWVIHSLNINSVAFSFKKEKSTFENVDFRMHKNFYHFESKP